MLPIDEILSFSRGYINNKKERTFLRKRKIKAAYKELFGKDINGYCATCYIEALLKIVKSFNKIKKMATSNYELKRGVLLESFGHPEKTCTNDTLTDELAEWHLRRCPEKAVFFARLPGGIITPLLPPIQPPPPPPARTQGGEKWIVPPDKIIIPPGKIAQEDQVKRKLLIDRAIELGFKSSTENPIELISSDELNIIIPNLEKAKLELENKNENKLSALKKSLKVNKDKLIEIARQNNLSSTEWENLNKSDLANYLFDKLSKKDE